MEARERKYERKFKNVKRHLKNLSENKFFNESYVEVMVADKMASHSRKMRSQKADIEFYEAEVNEKNAKLVAFKKKLDISRYIIRKRISITVCMLS